MSEEKRPKTGSCLYPGASLPFRFVFHLRTNAFSGCGARSCAKNFVIVSFTLGNGEKKCFLRDPAEDLRERKKDFTRAHKLD